MELSGLLRKSGIQVEENNYQVVASEFVTFLNITILRQFSKQLSFPVSRRYFQVMIPLGRMLGNLPVASKGIAGQGSSHLTNLLELRQ